MLKSGHLLSSLVLMVMAVTSSELQYRKLRRIHSNEVPYFFDYYLAPGLRELKKKERAEEHVQKADGHDDDDDFSSIYKMKRRQKKSRRRGRRSKDKY